MKRLLIACGLTLSLFNNVFAIPDVKLSAITALPGDSDELLLTISNNTDTAGLELQVTFDETQVSVGTPGNGVDLSGAHSLASYSRENNSIHILVYPDPNNNIVPNGQIIRLPVSLLAGATAGNKTLTITQTELSNNAASSVVPERVTSGILVDPTAVALDSDSDGIPDVNEVANNLHPLDERDATLDFDNDGLDNLGEYQAGTSMTNPDTDGDGFSDGAEVIAGTNPLVPDLPTVADNDGEFDSVQTLGVAWGNGNYADIINDIHIDTNDNVYKAGSYRLTLDFDHTSGDDSKTSGAYNDAFVTKNNANDGYEWTWVSKGYYGAYVTNVASDSANNVYISGYFSGLTDFDPDPNITEYRNSRYGWDMFYAKLNSSGELQWVNAFYYWGTGSEYANGLTIDSTGNLYIVGYFDGNSIDFDPSSNDDFQDRLGYPTSFLSKLDSNGNYAWTQRIGASNASATVQDLQVDSNDNIIVGGKFSGTVNFDANDADNNGDYISKVSNGSDDIFVMQYSSNGSVNWLYTVGTNHQDQYRALTLDGSNVILLTEMYDPVDFNAAGSGDIQGGANWSLFMTKLNDNGSYGSTQMLLDTVVSNYVSVAANQLGNLFIAGTFYQTNIDVNPDPNIAEFISTNGAKDIYLLKYDASGNYVWTKTIGGTGNETIESLAFNSNGDLYLGGTFYTNQSVVDFDPGPGLAEKSSNGYEDIYMLKLKAAQ